MSGKPRRIPNNVVDFNNPVRGYDVRYSVRNKGKCNCKLGSGSSTRVWFNEKDVVENRYHWFAPSENSSMIKPGQVTKQCHSFSFVWPHYVNRKSGVYPLTIEVNYNIHAAQGYEHEVKEHNYGNNKKTIQVSVIFKE